MTITAVDPYLWPGLVWRRDTISTGLSVTNAAQATLNAANYRAAVVFQAPITGSLTDILFKTATVAVTSGPLNWDARVETVSNGKPSGTLWAANTNIALSVADTDDNVQKVCTFTSAASITQGDLVAFVLRSPASGTFSLTIGGYSNLQASLGNFPAGFIDATGDGTYEAIFAGAPTMLLKISGDYYRIEPLLPIFTATANTYGSGSNPNEYALRLYSPVGLRIKGAAMILGNISAGADFTVSLWPDSGSAQTNANALAQCVVDGDQSSSATNDGCFNVLFASPPTIAANTPYWLGVRADAAPTLIAYSGTGFGSTTTESWPGGIEVYGGTRQWAAGSANAFTHFTNDNGSPFFAALVDGIDIPASGGGMRIAGHGGLAA